MSVISSTALIELALDLSRCISSEDRFDLFISAVRKTIFCEAVAILSYQDDVLTPLAQQGLSSDTLGRRFLINEHIRFEQICHSAKAVRFSPDCGLPDPYDGLLIDSDEDLPIHACMGVPLYFDGALIGIMTFDSLSTGAFDDIAERTLELIASLTAANLYAALRINRLEQNYMHSKQVVEALSLGNDSHHQHELIGQSVLMNKLKKDISLVASSDFNVLIYGESGVGKELVVHNIHAQSDRSKSPLVYVNCAALPENLIESELFGHQKGAFTGADRNRPGKFLIADNGTLFLDEVGELPLTAQSKLLRAIQSHEIQPVGQDKVVKVNVRVLAATNRDLKKEVENGNFRSDLYHRLEVFPISVPALRDRQEDIVLLSGFFVENTRRKLGLPQLKFSPSAQSALLAYQWPGNVRELEHVISRAALKAVGRNAEQNAPLITIQTLDLGLQVNSIEITKSNVQQIELRQINLEETPIDSNIGLRAAMDSYQRQVVIEALNRNQGNISASAKQLKVDRANLNRLIKRLGIKMSTSAYF